MAFERLGPIVKRVVSRVVNEVGEGAIEPAPDAVKLAKSRKEAGTVKAPASQEVAHTNSAGDGISVDGRERVRTTQPGKAPASLGNAKGRRTHPHELAPLGVRQPLMLRVIEGGLGGGPAGSGGEGRAAYAQAAAGGRTATSNLLKLVHASTG